jgi:hypothetical protein
LLVIGASFPGSDICDHIPCPYDSEEKKCSSIAISLIYPTNNMGLNTFT